MFAKTSRCPNPYKLPITLNNVSLPKELDEDSANSPEYPRSLDQSFLVAARSIESSLLQINTWLSDCHDNHPDCFYLETSLPTRVLDVDRSDKSRVFLVEPQYAIDRYISLSYCWGDAQFFKLTKENFSSCKEGILIDNLPVCFQHAIKIARGLRIKYIWIDALCIIQDDIKDWKIQAAKMARIYQNAFLVIAMSKASRPDQDCLGEVAGVNVDSVHARIFHHMAPWVERLGNPFFPLTRRGWAYQERFLAQRLVHFGPHEPIWECSSSTYCECGRQDQGEAATRGAGWEKLIFQAMRRKLVLEPNATVDDSDYLWRDIVQRYSSLELTFHDDKLPALSGIVDALSWMGIKPTAYLAGLWCGSLVQDLLWKTVYADSLKSTKSPSWSWAAIMGPVQYPFNSAKLWKVHDLCEVIDSRSYRNEEERNTTSGWIKLKVRMLKCHQTSKGIATFSDGESCLPDSVPVGHWFDDCSLRQKSFTFFMIRLATITYRGTQNTITAVLLIREVEGLEGCFERIGMTD